MSMTQRTWRNLLVMVPLAVGAATVPVWGQSNNAPAPPSDVQASDHPWDGGERVDLTWRLSPDNLVRQYAIQRTYTTSSIAQLDGKLSERITHFEQEVRNDADDEFAKKTLCKLRDELAELRKNDPVNAGTVSAAVSRFEADGLDPKLEYVFHVAAVGEGGVKSAAASSPPISPRVQYFDGNRGYLVI